MTRDLQNATFDPSCLDGLETDRKVEQAAANSTDSENQDWSENRIKPVKRTSQNTDHLNVNQSINRSQNSLQTSMRGSQISNDELFVDYEEDEKGKYDFTKLARMASSSALLKNMSFNVDVSKLYSVVGSACNN